MCAYALDGKGGARSLSRDEAETGGHEAAWNWLHFDVEDLDTIRDRAAALHEEITAQFAEQMNTTMYRLSVVATIFLPLTLLTGLLGINVGGTPGVENGWAFWTVTWSLILMGVAGYWLMKRWKMI